MRKRALVVGLAMLAIGVATVEANEAEMRLRQLRIRNVQAAEQVLCNGAEIKKLEKNSQFGVPVMVGTEQIVSYYGDYEVYRVLRQQFVLSLIEREGLERSNTTVVMLTAKFFPIRGDSIFDAQDKARLREEIMQKAAQSVLFAAGNSYEQFVSNTYAEVSIACSDGDKLNIKRRSSSVQNAQSRQY